MVLPQALLGDRVDWPGALLGSGIRGSPRHGNRLLFRRPGPRAAGIQDDVVPVALPLYDRPPCGGPSLDDVSALWPRSLNAAHRPSAAVPARSNSRLMMRTRN